MRLLENRIYLEEKHEISKAKLAVLKACRWAMGLDFHADLPYPLDEGTSHKVIKGLASIALGEAGPDFHGLKREYADGLLASFYGVPDNYIPESWLDSHENI